MGDILELIKSRRNIQAFIPKFVSWENISRILDAARHAPSCGNVQNWKFIIIYDLDQKRAIAEACYEQYEIVQASTLIVVCAEPEKAERYYGSRGERLYTVQNCAAAIQNMLLEAHSLGLGTRWVGGFDEEALKSRLAIPEEIRPQAVVAVGYAKDLPPKPPKYPLETLVYFYKWRNKIRDPVKYANDIAAIMARKVNVLTGALSGAVGEVASEVAGKTREKVSKLKEKMHKN